MPINIFCIFCDPVSGVTNAGNLPINHTTSLWWQFIFTLLACMHTCHFDPSLHKLFQFLASRPSYPGVRNSWLLVMIFLWKDPCIFFLFLCLVRGILCGSPGKKALKRVHIPILDHPNNIDLEKNTKSLQRYCDRSLAVQAQPLIHGIPRKGAEGRQIRGKKFSTPDISSFRPLLANSVVPPMEKDRQTDKANKTAKAKLSESLFYSCPPCLADWLVG